MLHNCVIEMFHNLPGNFHGLTLRKPPLQVVHLKLEMFFFFPPLQILHHILLDGLLQYTHVFVFLGIAYDCRFYVTSHHSRWLFYSGYILQKPLLLLDRSMLFQKVKCNKSEYLISKMVIFKTVKFLKNTHLRVMASCVWVKIGTEYFALLFDCVQKRYFPKNLKKFLKISLEADRELTHIVCWLYTFFFVFLQPPLKYFCTHVHSLEINVCVWLFTCLHVID